MSRSGLSRSEMSQSRVPLDVGSQLPQSAPTVLRRVLPAIAFVSIALAIVVGAHYYLALRLVVEPGWPSPWREGLVAAIVVFGFSLIGYFVAERLLKPPWIRLVTVPSGLWMGLAFLCVVLLGLSDAASLLVAASITRDHVSLRAVSVATVAGLVVAIGFPRALRPPSIRRVEVPLARWPAALDGFRIVQISDIHIGPILGRGFASALVAKVNALDPDLIAVTGDLVDGHTSLIADEVAPFGALRAKHGVFFVTGNHDYYSDARAWVEEVRKLGFNVLRNERARIRVGSGEFDVAGVEDHRAHQVDPHWREDVDAALQDRDPNVPVVLLAHDPTTFRIARTRGVDLQLSGHTHGGQIWPFGLLVRIVVPWLAGLYHDGAATLYVSRGTGFWGPPLRLGAPAEITELVLRRAGFDA